VTNVSAIAHDKNKLVFVGDQCFSYKYAELKKKEERVKICLLEVRIMFPSGETLLCVALMMYHYKHPTGRVCLDYKTSPMLQL
jgi:hypothetical protein